MRVAMIQHQATQMQLAAQAAMVHARHFPEPLPAAGATTAMHRSGSNTLLTTMMESPSAHGSAHGSFSSAHGSFSSDHGSAHGSFTRGSFTHGSLSFGASSTRASTQGSVHASAHGSASGGNPSPLTSPASAASANAAGGLSADPFEMEPATWPTDFTTDELMALLDGDLAENRAEDWTGLSLSPPTSPPDHLCALELRDPALTVPVAPTRTRSCLEACNADAVREASAEVDEYAFHSWLLDHTRSLRCTAYVVFFAVIVKTILRDDVLTARGVLPIGKAGAVGILGLATLALLVLLYAPGRSPRRLRLASRVHFAGIATLPLLALLLACRAPTEAIRANVEGLRAAGWSPFMVAGWIGVVARLQYGARTDGWPFVAVGCAANTARWLVISHRLEASVSGTGSQVLPFLGVGLCMVLGYLAYGHIEASHVRPVHARLMTACWAPEDMTPPASSAAMEPACGTSLEAGESKGMDGSNHSSTDSEASESGSRSDLDESFTRVSSPVETMEECC